MVELEDFDEIIDRATAIKGVLDGYPASNAILRELIQNSDDAKSHKQQFILDERRHPASKLLRPGLEHCQGPALLAVNDSVFRPQDWKAIRTLNVSSKTDDPTAAGKFGLGFRSTYHVTDFPHILSGTALAVFDPHQAILEKPGIRHPDFLPAQPGWKHQLLAFDSVVDEHATEFAGTVIRLPLRTASSPKRISTFIPTVAWVKDLFRNFIEQELDVQMLFLKHVESIELVHISPTNVRTQLAYSRLDGDRVHRALGAVSGPHFVTFRVNVESIIHGSPTTSKCWRIAHWFAPAAETQSAIRRAVVGLSAGELEKEKLFPHAACAFPIDGSAASANFNGRLFTLLPLPIYPGFPVHCHAIFALTPTRQGLKNSQEAGLISRDLLLVVWNQVMFDTVIAAAWAKLMLTLLLQDGVRDAYALWPRSDNTRNDAYWENMTASILRVVLRDGMSVWPVHGAVSTSFVSLDACLVASPGTDCALLSILSRVGIDVILPPQYLFALLPRDRTEVLSPSSVHDRLIKEPRNVLEKLTKEQRSHLADYLVSAGDVDCIAGLHLIPLHGGGYAALRPAANAADGLVLCDELACAVFGNCSRLLAATHLMGTVLQQALQRQNVQTAYTVVPLSSSLAHAFVVERTCSISPMCEESQPLPEMMPWIHAFWIWAAAWFDFGNLLPLLRDIHLLPTQRATIRRISDGVVSCEGDSPTPAAVSALQLLAVPFLHSDAGRYLAILQRSACVRTVWDLRYLLERIDLDCLPKLVKKHKEGLKRHFLATLAGPSPSMISDRLLTQKLRSLPIFDVVSTRIVRDDVAHKHTELGTISGSVFFLGAEVNIVPLIPNVTLVDNSDLGFIAALGTSGRLDESSLLAKSAEYLEEQPQLLLDHILHRILCRWSDIRTTPAVGTILRSAILPVNTAGTKRCALSTAIDPTSDIGAIFSPADEVFPAGKFRRETQWGTLLISCGVLQTRLSESMTVERMRTFASNRDSRALELLRLLDRHYTAFPDTNWQLPKSLAFLPDPRNSNRLYSLQGCRDSRDRHLFDLVIPLLALPFSGGCLQSRNLRTAVGWGDVPYSTICEQVQMIATSTATDRPRHSEHLMKIIQYLTVRVHRDALPANVLESLRRITQDVEWIPISKTVLCKTVHATRDVELGPFKRVPSSLREPEDRFAFLSRMGCGNRPTLQALVTELRALAQRQAADRIEIALLILMEIVEHHVVAGEVRSRVMLPDVAGVMREIDDIYFCNVEELAAELASTTNICHPSLSQSIAVALDLPKVTDLFAQRAEVEDEDDDEDDFGEDLYDRIRNVLRDYNPEFALNEFLANANDARAASFAVLLDERSVPLSLALSPELAECQSGPTLILYNNARFTMDDFRRVKRFGRMKEVVAAHAIGQFGLGALSYWHFCDVVTIISGNDIMFIDPSTSFLPQRDRRRKRSSLRYKITSLRRSAPDHLLRLNGLFGFTESTELYDGTMILLHLRTSARAKTSLLSEYCPSALDVHMLITRYFDSARLSLFCTTLRDVRAQRRRADGDAVVDLWSITSQFEPDRTDEGVASRRLLVLQLHNSEPSTSLPPETWFIHSAIFDKQRIPSELRPFLRKEQLVVTLIAAPHASQLLQGRILAAVPLPVSTALPIHISAPFVVASDRRSLRFDSPNASGDRGAESNFNAYVLSHVVPKVYFELLEHLATTEPYSTQRAWGWWPRVSSDPVTETVVNAFWLHLAASSQRMLPVAAPGRFTTVRAGVVCFGFGDRTSYQSLLVALKPDDLICPPSQLQKEGLFQGVDRVSPGYVRRILLQREPELQRLLCVPATMHPALPSLLTYLLDGDIALDGLRLLPLHTGQIGVFGTGTAYYALKTTSQPPLCFPPTCFVDTDERLGGELRDRLVARANNVHSFDSTGVRQLLEHHYSISPRETYIAAPRPSQSIAAFWGDFLENRIPARFDQLADLPLLRTNAAHHYVSFDFCKSGRAVLLPSYLGRDLHALVTDLSSSGMRFLDPIVREVVPVSDRRSLEFGVATVLGGLRRLGDLVSAFSRVRDQEFFARWIRDELGTLLDKSDIERIPIWWTYSSNGVQSLRAAEALFMLPSGWSPAELLALSRFLPAGLFWAAYDQRLAPLLPPNRKLSTTQAFAAIVLPLSLSVSQVQDLKHVLNLMGPGTMPSCALIPDVDGVVRCPQNMFDHRVPLFMAAFSGSFGFRFIHRGLYDAIDHLISLGVRRAVNIDTFLEAVRAVNNDCERGDLDVIRAEQVSESFFEELPATLRRQDVFRWADLRSLHFVPRARGQVSGLSFDTSPYIIDLDAVVAPGDVVRGELEMVAWTQCARLPDRLQATGPLIGVFRDFGIPSVPIVVNHLVQLATVVAPDHPGNGTLLGSLKDTYEWLCKRSEEAGPHLSPLRRLPLFLNIDSPADVWRFRPASALVVGLWYDQERLFRVNDWLLPYKELLLAAGATPIVQVDFKQTVRSSTGTQAIDRAGILNGMRIRGELTDFQLIAKETKTVFHAHKAVLAATSEHLRERFSGGWGDAPSDLIDESDFCVESVLSFLYIGRINRPTVGTSEEAGIVVGDLLDLLQLADLWYIDGLKDEVATILAEELKLVKPDTVRHIAQYAETFHAEALKTYCAAYIESNKDALRRLESDS